MGGKRTSEIYSGSLPVIQQNTDEHMCVRKLSQTGQGPSKRIRTMPGVHTGPRIVPATISQTGKFIIHGTLGKVLRKILTQWWGIFSLRLITALELHYKS